MESLDITAFTGGGGSRYLALRAVSLCFYISKKALSLAVPFDTVIFVAKSCIMKNSIHTEET